jgi:exodeoxyribonuclease V beta subunit
MNYEQLNPLTTPLEGLRLIEASAGTGKTWVIAALYVRAVLGHGGQPARLPPEILVVTFTRDATAELRERIRARLEQAAAAFRAGGADEAFLQGLIDDYPDVDARSRAARQLEVAAQWMDEAAIHTIHSWANRMLTRHAFDSGRSFAEAAEADQHEHVAEVCRDYWRREVYALAPHHFERVTDGFDAGPDTLAKAVFPLLAKQLTARIEGGVEPEPTLAATLDSVFGRHAAALEAEREAWAEHILALRKVQPVLEDGLAKNKRIGKNFVEWLKQIEAWVGGEPLTLSADDLRQLGEANLLSALKQGKVLPDCPAYAAAEKLADLILNMPTVRPIVLRHALQALPAAIARAKALRGEIGFDDMLSELDRALDAEHGEHLSKALRTQLPLALIDEFQDTDPLQWRIFSRVYGPGGALLLIGDPKQSIYGFRGADIGTYFRARSAAAQPALTLSRNFRSSADLVRAVNTLFERADEIAPDGAFGYGKDDTGLRFQPVEAEGHPLALVVDGQPAPALCIAVPGGDEPINKGRFTQLMAEAAAERVASWLVMQSGARICEQGKDERPVRPSDIAILVRTGQHADFIRAELRRRGLASVYLSDKQSVYASNEAKDLLHWLVALSEPVSDRALRAALATGSAAFTFAEIDQVATDDIYRDALLDVFAAGARLWRERGVLAAVRHLIHALNLPERHASTDDAERCLTNLLHVAELLQHAAVDLDGEHALLRYLAEAIETSDEPRGDSSGATIQRLESEADLVRVITIHKSKGLQYKLVLIPFACGFRDVNPSKDSHFEFERDGERIVSLEPTDNEVKLARRASIREEVRLFYVAVTRAEIACWVGAGAVVDGQSKVNGAPLSGLGRLLGGGAELGPADVHAAVEALIEREPSIQMQLLSGQIPLTMAPRAEPLTSMPTARQISVPQTPAWWLSSYSTIVQGPRHSGVDVASAAEAVPLEEYTDRKTSPAEALAELTVHTFPRGREFGSFLHYLLEWTALSGFGRVLADPAQLEAEVSHRADAAGLSVWVPTLLAWILGFLAAPLPLPNGRVVALKGLGAGRARPEFAFMVEANSVRIRQLDRVVTEHMLPGAPRPPLTQKHLNGMLSGFIDLVFEHEGAWYTLDYKSNHLSNTTEGYTEAAMTEEMARHRYDLQAALYLLALHRFLRARLPGYDPARHIGGVIYPFLRGVGQGTGVFAVRPDGVLLDELDALFAGDRKHAA